MSFQLNIIGGAYFEVQRPDFSTVYSLSRRFLADNSGIIITAEEYILLNQTVIPPPYDEPVAINEQGQVSVFLSGTWQIIGQIMVVMFQNHWGLQDLGNGYYAATPESGVPQVGIPGEGIFENVKIFYINEVGKKQRPIAALNVPGALGDFIIKARMIVQMMTNNAGEYFTNPSPSLATVTADINALEAAEDVAKTRIVGSAAERDKAYDKALRDLHGLQLYVQTLADKAEDNDDAIAIISNSGFEVKSHGIYTKDALNVKHGKASGTVMLIAKAIKGSGAYEWQMSYDNATWTNIPATIEANTSVKALPPSSLIYFRCRAVKKTGVEGWSQAVSIIVT